MDQLGVLIAEELKRSYIDERTSLDTLRDQRIEPNALIFGYQCRGKSPVKLYKIDVTRRLYRIDDVPLDTPVYELSSHMVDHLKGSVYQTWYWDDGVAIRPLIKVALPHLLELINVQLTPAPIGVESLTTYI